MAEIVVAGRSLLDTFLQSDAFERPRRDKFSSNGSEKAGPHQLLECFVLGAKIDLTRVTRTVGGGGLNAATCFARLGHTPYLVSTVGDDHGRVDVLAHARLEGIRPLVEISKLATGESFIILNRNGERTILTFDDGGHTQSVQDILVRLHNGTALYYGVHHLAPKQTNRVFKSARGHGMKICWTPGLVDFSDRRSFQANARLVDILILNESEAAHVSGEDTPKELDRFFRNLSTTYCVITKGKQGSLLLYDGLTLEAVAPKVSMVDSTGAGDAFAASFLAALLTRDDPRNALREATLNSGSVVRYVGSTAGLLRQIPNRSVTIREH